VVQEGYKECPYCAEEIKAAAKICRFCKSPQPGVDTSDLPPGVGGAPAGDRPAATEAEQRLQEQVNRLRKFVPAKVMQRLTDGFADAIEEGERRNITVLFADLCGFTALSEGLDPEDLADLMERCYHEMNRVIEKFDGTIDKFIGDCCMALFGAPIAHEDDPERAIRAALEIRAGIRRIGEEEGHPLDLSVGINTGEVVVKSFGDETRADYSALGDAVNLASRLQGKAERGDVLVSKAVWARTRSLFEWRDVEPFMVKGKSMPITAFVAVSESARFAKEVQLRERVEMVDCVGRQTEIETLLANWRGVRRGRRRVALIEGEAGVGKSRLVYEFFRGVERESGEPPRSFTGRCLSFGQHMAHLPMIEMVKEFADIGEGDSAEEVRGKIHETVGRLAEGAGDALKKADKGRMIQALEFLMALRQTTNPLMKLEAKERQRVIFEAIGGLIRLVSLEGPFVLVLEDLHWADASSLELIDHLLEHGGTDVPVLVLLLSRPESGHTFPLPDDSTRISLSELDEQLSAELLRRLCGLDILPVDLETRILSKTEGNPFYVEEIVLDLKEQGLLVEREGTWRLEGDPRKLEIPETVQGVILARLDRLAVQIRRVLQCASVIGHSFQHRVLTQVSEVHEQLEQMLTELVDVEYIFEKSALPELIYLFRHVVTQEVTYHTLLKRRRGHFHGRVAEAIELIFADRTEEHLEILAHHWHLSGNLPKSRHYLREAGCKCQRMYANEAAIDLYTKLLGVLDRSEIDESERLQMRAETLRELGLLKMIIGDHPGSADDLREAIRLAGEEESLEDLRARLSMNLSQVLRLMGEMTEAASALRLAQEIFSDRGDRGMVRACRQALGVIAQIQGDYDTALEEFQAYLRALDTDDGNLHRAYLGHANVGIIQMLRGNMRSAKSHLEQALALAQEGRDRRAMAESHHNLSLVSLRQGRCDEAKSHSIEAYRLAHEIGFQRVQLACDITMGELYNFTGECPAAIHHCRRAVDFAAEHQHADVMATARGNWARALLNRGDVDEAIAMAAQALSEARQYRDHTAQVNALLVQAEAHLSRGKALAAIKASREALRLLDEHGDEDNRPQTLRVLAEALAAAGQTGEVGKLLRAALKAAEEKGDPRDVAWVQASRAALIKSAETRREALTAAKRIAKRIGDAILLERLTD
jgi:predicted ATPase/class 3 adenylate cyclase